MIIENFAFTDKLARLEINEGTSCQYRADGCYCMNVSIEQCPDSHHCDRLSGKYHQQPHVKIKIEFIADDM